MSAKVRRFRPTRKLGTVLVVLLGLTVVCAAVLVVLRLSEISLLQRLARGELVSGEEAARSDDRVAAMTITAFVVLVVSGPSGSSGNIVRRRTSTRRGSESSSTRLAGRSAGGSSRSPTS